MALPPPSNLYTLSFLLAALATLFVIASLRLLVILPNSRSRPQRRQSGTPTRILIVLGSGGHTHEMFYLLRGLDTSKYTHRTYVVSSGDAFSAQRAVEFERNLETLAKEYPALDQGHGTAAAQPELASQSQGQEKQDNTEEAGGAIRRKRAATIVRTPHLGPQHYNIATIPRARRIHQSLLTTPLTSLYTLLSALPILLSSPPLLPDSPPQDAFEAAARDLPDLIVTNGPATAVIVVLASLLLKFFNVRGAQGRGKCKTVYVESFARVKTLSLSGRLLVRIVDRFLVQWEELEGAGGRAEFWGILV